MVVRGNKLGRRFARCTDDFKISLFKAFCQNLYMCCPQISDTKTFSSNTKISSGCCRIFLDSALQAKTDGFQVPIRKKVELLKVRLRGSDNSFLRQWQIILMDLILRSYVWILTEVQAPPPPGHQHHQLHDTEEVVCICSGTAGG